MKAELLSLVFFIFVSLQAMGEEQSCEEMAAGKVKDCAEKCNSQGGRVHFVEDQYKCVIGGNTRTPDSNEEESNESE